MNQYYKTDIINSANTQELLVKTMEENQELQAELKKNHTDILTNDRKTYYETTASDKLTLWYRFWWYVYYIVVVILAIALFASPSQLSIVKKIALLVVVVFYPYYIHYIVNWYIQFKNALYQKLPKNMYNNL
jgi:hypothetical protein